MNSRQESGPFQAFHIMCQPHLGEKRRRENIRADLLPLPWVAVVLCWGGLSCSGSIGRAMESWQEYNYSDIYLWKAALHKASLSPWQHDFLSSSHLLLSPISERERDRKRINSKNGRRDTPFILNCIRQQCHILLKELLLLYILMVFLMGIHGHCWMGFLWLLQREQLTVDPIWLWSSPKSPVTLLIAGGWHHLF